MSARFPTLPGTGGSRTRSRIIVAATVVVALVAIFFGSGAVASSPRVCRACHEMRPKVDSWSVSPHAEVGCHSCHSQPRRWYGAPLAVIDSWRLLGRDINAHWSSRQSPSLDTTASNAASGTPIPDRACLRCHDPNRQATSRYGLVIKHAEHARRNDSCVSCHLWAAHPDPNSSRATLMMARCFNCHGTAAQPKASGECIVCHVKDVDLKPPTHKTPTWLKQHGKEAKADRKQCVMCHRQESCDSCHGVVIPHPLGWARGASGHAVVASKDKVVCARCHPGSANLCTMCHHQGFNDRKGPWVTQHPNMVIETGAAFCFKCHEVVFCANCHVSGSPTEGAAQ